MKIADLERMLEEEGDAALFSAAEVRPLLRLARAAKEQHDWMCGDGGPDAGHAHFLVVSEALAAFDFTE